MLLRSILFCLLITPSLIHAADQTLDFAHDVLPILKKHCAECHTDGEYKGSFSLDTRAAILDSEMVEQGKANESILIERVRESDPELRMPPAPDHDALTEKQIEILEHWINSGLGWQEGFTFKSSVYEPPLALIDVELPASVDGRDHPLDRLIDHYLAGHQVKQPAPIHDAQFMRRVSLDLTGLLPEPKDLQEFVNSSDPDKRAKLIEHLLADQQAYAQHWLSFWNDLLRNDYKGTGYIDGGRKQISGWLYQALVDNKPYNQFVRELISPTPDSEGFIKGIKWRGDVNASQTREIQFAQNIGQVFLGINLKCASCHDSFIDNWTLEQTYALASIYAQTPQEIHRCDKPTGKISQAEFQLFPELGNVDAAAEQPERLRQLASLLTSEQNGRLARTIVNRIWQRLIGRGIVHPVDAMGTRPWNEDLLNFLASDFVAHDWDIKYLIRFITTSKAYQSQTQVLEELPATDNYVYAGPIAKRLTAEQFVDGIWKITLAGPAMHDAPISLGSSDIPLTGEWIWGFEGGKQTVPEAGEQRTFRKQFALETLPQRIGLIITADNEYTAYLNGRRIGRGTNWMQPNLFNPLNRLQVGNNELVIVAKNAGDAPNWAGLYAEMVIETDSGELIKMATSDTWEWSAVVPANSASLKYSEEPTWEAVTIFQKHPWAPVAAAIQSRRSRLYGESGSFVRASLVKSDLLQRSLGRPNREQVVTSRPELLTTLQAIDLANGPLLSRLIQQGAKEIMIRHRASTTEQILNDLYLSLISREPLESERQIALSLIEEADRQQGVEDLLWILIMHPEYQLIR